MEPRKSDCYSDGDRGWMEWSQRLRAAVLRPILIPLARRGLHQDHLTALQLALGLGFCPLWILGHPIWAFGALFMHVLVDGLDGPLARFREEASRAGSFTDSMADQCVITATTLTLIYTGSLSPWAGGSYIFVYTLVVAFAMIRNALAIPYAWLVRPRFLVYAWLPVEQWLWPGSLEVVVLLATAILGIKAVSGFWSIKQRI